MGNPNHLADGTAGPSHQHATFAAVRSWPAIRCRSALHQRFGIHMSSSKLVLLTVLALLFVLLVQLLTFWLFG
jgi:hypothetical protein